MKSKVYRVDPPELERFLERRRRASFSPSETSLAENLDEVLHKANEFVPSESGSILLDDPVNKQEDRRRNVLTFIASFGDKARSRVGRTLKASQGIAGHVYLTGRSYHTADARSDPFFYPGIDQQTRYRTRSIVAIPIRIGQEVCGVLELINRDSGYTDEDCKLLEIFAGYISVSIQNVLDAKQAQEIAKRDNLTGLCNDRYLHIALASSVTDCQQDGADLGVLFLDLDYFKRVNDSHGHLTGSQVLREVGHLLRRMTPDPHGIAARYGGDEFVVVLPRLTLQETVDLAEKIRCEIDTTTFCEEPGAVQPKALHIRGLTCSIGVAGLRRHVTDDMPVERVTMALLHLADAAMYVAKETGRNRTAVAGKPVRRRTRRKQDRKAESDRYSSGGEDRDPWSQPVAVLQQPTTEEDGSDDSESE